MIICEPFRGREPVQILINDTPREIADGLTLAALFQELGVPSRLTAVVRNGKMLQKEQYPQQRLQAGDRLEIVTLAGGG